MTKMGPIGSLRVKGDLIASQAGLVSKLYVTGNVNLGPLKLVGTTFFGINTTSASALGLDPKDHGLIKVGFKYFSHKASAAVEVV